MVYEGSKSPDNENTTVVSGGFNPTISSSRYGASACSRCRFRSLGGRFLPGQTSSRGVLLVSSSSSKGPEGEMMMGVDVSGICDDSNYFSFEKNVNNTVFSSTMITSL